jgi:tetratricopeptide (TPR) repeat protein
LLIFMTKACMEASMLRKSLGTVVVLATALGYPILSHADDPSLHNHGLGRVHFQTSCTPEAQSQFERALAMLHSFFFPETVKAFNAIPETDPNCAIAYWGIAISQRPNPLVGPFDAAILKRGLEAVEKGKAIGAKTERERDWLAAIEEFYRDYDKVDQDTRTKNYEKAMEALAKKYPDDVEAKIFYALALNETFDHKSMDNLVKAIDILEPIDKAYPDHPGVTHYLIHSYDFPPLADRGIAFANKYARIAPAAPHAQHMPSHIYTMVGMWNESIRSNLRSNEVAADYAKKAKLDGTMSGVPHAYDFMEYAYLQLGQDAKAKALIEETAAVKKVIGARLAGSTARAAVPARYMLERQDWRGAAQLVPLGSEFLPAEAITHFARTLGAARSGELAAAEADLRKLDEIRTELAKANQTYWAGQVEIQVLGARAWLAHAQGKKDEAIKFMRSAADLEDASEKHVAMENRLYPMRELLGDMLMEDGQAQEALTEYERSIKNARERLRGYYGAAKAAEASGDKEKATNYFQHLIRLTKDADTERPEIREAKQKIAAR